MKVLRYLMRHKAVLLGITLLLFVQAYCDLSLPNYTAHIVDVGIAQNGIERAVPEKMSTDTFDALRAIMAAEDAPDPGISIEDLQKLSSTPGVAASLTSSSTQNQTASTTSTDTSSENPPCNPELQKSADQATTDGKASAAVSATTADPQSPAATVSANTADPQASAASPELASFTQAMQNSPEFSFDTDAIKTLTNSYDLSDGIYKLNDYGKDHINDLEQTLIRPLVLYSGAKSQMDTSFDLSEDAFANPATRVMLASLVHSADDKLADIDESILQKQAINAVADECKNIGISLDDTRNDYLFYIGGIMAALTALGAIASIIVSFLASRTAASIGQRLRRLLFGRVVSLSDAEISKFSPASLITRGTNDIQQIQMVSFFMMRVVLYAPILSLGGLYMILRTDMSMGWVIALAIVAMLVVIVLLMTVAMPKFKRMQKLIDAVNRTAREILQGLPVIRAFNRQEHESRRFEDASYTLMKNQLFTNRVMVLMQPLMMLIMNAVSVLIVWTGAHYIDAGSMETGDMIAFITYSMVIIMGFLMISAVAIMLPRADVAAGRIDEVIDTVPSITDPETPKDDELHPDKGITIDFESASFTYENSSEPVLSDITLHVPAGSTLGIIGSTGSGKTTLLKLMMRFLDTSTGAVKLNQINVRDLRVDTLHKLFGYVPQQSFLFSGTIGSNIAYADGDMPKERIEQAARIAQARDFISERTDGFDDVTAQGGTNVSGGQRQRISIARAIASDAPVLVFDDSTSALDYDTDAALRSALAHDLPGKTLVIVAQRIASVRQADQILVLDEGRIAGIGTHDELIKTCEAYQQIARSQLTDEELKGGLHE